MTTLQLEAEVNSLLMQLMEGNVSFSDELSMMLAASILVKQGYVKIVRAVGKPSHELKLLASGAEKLKAGQRPQLQGLNLSDLELLTFSKQEGASNPSRHGSSSSECVDYGTSKTYKAR